MKISRIGFDDRQAGRLLRAALRSGTFASVASSIALALCGRTEIRDAAAPLNGPSQWVWGRHAKYRNGFSLRHTVLGYAIHHAASIFWALFFEGCRPARAGKAVLPTLGAAAATSATAAFVDYQLTPPRFRPGFEKRLSRPALVTVYAAFALGLAAACLSRRR